MFETTLEKLIEQINIYGIRDHERFSNFRDKFQASSNVGFFDNAFKEICNLLENNYFPDFFDKNKYQLKTITDILEPISILYCYYFSGDYLQRHREHKAFKFSPYIKEFYSVKSTEAHQISRNLARAKKEVLESLSYIDPAMVNLQLLVNYNCQKKEEAKSPKFYPAHIYSNNILLYLKKVISTNETVFAIHDFVPSMSFIALKAAASLPNGGDTNKSADGINSKRLMDIDNSVTGESIFKKIPNVPVFKENRLGFYADQEVARSVNLAAVDDIYRMDRLNYALIKYAEYIQKYRTLAKFETKEDMLLVERAVAGVCSLYLSFPLVFGDFLKSDFELILEDIITKRQVCKTQIYHIISFSSVVFPVIIGLLCWFLFGNHNLHSLKDNAIKEIDEIEKLHEQLGKRITKDSTKHLRYFKVNTTRIWHGNTSPSSPTYSFLKSNSINEQVDWNYPHTLSFEKVVDIMLNPIYNKPKIENLLDEQYYKFLGACEGIRYIT
ncbi:MAG: hypothetical protein ACLTKI_01855, partial [Lachnospiraceae bacterium]